MPAESEPDHHELRKKRLGELLRTLKEQGVTQQQVAARARVPAQYLCDVAAGRRTLTELFARRLQEEFRVDYLWLLGQSSSMEPTGAGNPSPSVGLPRVWLPVFPHPIESDPYAHPLWDGTAWEVIGLPAARVRTATSPYVLRFGADDRQGRLQKNDCLLLSQTVDHYSEIYVVKASGKAFLARRGGETIWEPLDPRRETTSAATPIGQVLGILWARL